MRKFIFKIMGDVMRLHITIEPTILLDFAGVIDSTPEGKFGVQWKVFAIRDFPGMEIDRDGNIVFFDPKVLAFRFSTSRRVFVYTMGIVQALYQESGFEGAVRISGSVHKDRRIYVERDVILAVAEEGHRLYEAFDRKQADIIPMRKSG